MHQLALESWQPSTQVGWAAFLFPLQVTAMVFVFRGDVRRLFSICQLLRSAYFLR
jgi:hypothetical protein